VSRPTTAGEYWKARREREARRPKPVVRPITERYCFCPQTPLWAERCTTCGKAPYTD